MLMNDASKASISLESSINELMAAVEQIEKLIDKTHQAFKIRDQLEPLVHVVETICFIVRFLQVIRGLMNKPSASKGARKKRVNKDQSNPEGKSLELRESFVVAQSRMKELCDNRMPNVCAKFLSNIKSLLPTHANASSFTWPEGTDSKFLSAKEVSNFLTILPLGNTPMFSH